MPEWWSGPRHSWSVVNMAQPEFEQLLAEHDERLRAAGIEVWVGMEPTFTNRHAETAEWLSEALGPAKIHYARELLQAMVREQPGGVVLHTLGRQYAGEDRPRWNVGYYQSREQQFTWEGPPDPFFLRPDSDQTDADGVPIDIQGFWRSLHAGLRTAGWQSSAFILEQDLGYRISFRCDGKPAPADIPSRPAFARPPVHTGQIPPAGLTDDLAADGDYLLCMGPLPADEERGGQGGLLIELPALPTVEAFLQLMQLITQAASRAAVPSLMIQGFPPPVDATIAWTTVTPDPAVVEVNQAPASDALSFFRRSEVSYNAAHSAGLCPYRLHYNGVVSDSGGGGQFTLGAAEPLGSPFLRYPPLLPRLIRYVNAHPAFSYWFAPPSIGSSSQSPRVDEGLSESFHELAVALEQLDKAENPSPEFIWRSLSPFLVDYSGNPHRSELNIEKLWNPGLPARGCLGLVEFRAFRMSRSPECAAAIAVLLRSIIAMLVREDRVSRLVAHGVDLHDRYALPFYLQRDLQAVFQDLSDAGLPLPASLRSLLLQEPVRFIGRAGFRGCYLELHQALEFWPLVGDVASQEEGGSRMIDASTARLQVIVGVEAHDELPLDGWELWLDGYQVPLRLEQDAHGPVKILGIRYRHFQPWVGLHPGIAARDHIRVLLRHRDLQEALEVTHYEWQPEGLPYPGLPVDLEDARERRRERITSRVVPVDGDDRPTPPPASAVSDYCLDLRRLS